MIEIEYARVNSKNKKKWKKMPIYNFDVRVSLQLSIFLTSLLKISLFVGSGEVFCIFYKKISQDPKKVEFFKRKYKNILICDETLFLNFLLKISLFPGSGEDFCIFYKKFCRDPGKCDIFKRKYKNILICDETLLFLKR